MSFKRLKEQSQIKLSIFKLSLPVFVFIFGAIITAIFANFFHQSEVRNQNDNLKAITREFYKIQNLMLNNSILRIETFNKISNLVRSKNILEHNFLVEIISNTMFQRASLFNLTNQKNVDGLPELNFVRRFRTIDDNLPMPKMVKMQSPYYRKKIKVLINENLPNILALSQSDEVTTIALIWRSLINKKDFILFSTSLRDFFKDWPQDQNLLAVLHDQKAGLEILVTQDPYNKTIKFISEKNKIDEIIRNNKFLIFSQYLVNENNGISIRWYQRSQNNPSLYVIVISIFGLTIALLTALLIRSILEQNRRIFKLVISRTHELEFAMNQAQEANLAKTRFLGNMSHELRTPLNLILGMIELLQIGMIDRINQGYLKNMQSAGEHLLSLITDLLTMSKEYSSDIKINQVPINISIFFEEIATIIGSECLKKNLSFYIDISHTIPTSLIGDPIKLRQILLNLLRNSLKYTNTGGLTLSVQLLKKEMHQKTISYLRFQVSDTGVGIPKNKMNLIFDRFFQIESSKMLSEGGVGLGLAIVKDLVSKMNGHINVNSELGVGTSFIIDLEFKILDDIAWINQYQLTQLPLKRKIALMISTTQTNDNVKNLLPSSVFETFEFNLESENTTTPDALITDFANDTIISKIKLRFPDIKITLLATDFDYKNIKNTTNLIWVSNTPILYSKLFDSLDFKFKRKITLIKAEQSDKPYITNAAPKKLISILAVDDDAGNRELLKAYLQDPQFNVIFAGDGKEALEKFIKNKPDLIIADLRMPHMNGFELATAIYKHESIENTKTPKTRTPFILLTADALESTSNDAKNYAISIFLTKPIRKNHLIQSIHKLVPLIAH
jgi:signal transduction histidine kinase/CheY-like chemotaxis protein